MSLRWLLAISAVLIGVSVAASTPAGAEPAAPGPATPGPAGTSSTDDLIDMVLDAIDHEPAAPSTTPVAPPR